jgi:hypothetical protein
MAEPHSADRRCAKRVRYLTEVACEGAGSRQTCRIIDLSTDGAFIESPVNYPPGAKLKLKFNVQSIEIEVTGEVRYSEPQIGMGVLFLDLTPEQQLAIEAVVNDESSS